MITAPRPRQERGRPELVALLPLLLLLAVLAGCQKHVDDTAAPGEPPATTGTGEPPAATAPVEPPALAPSATPGAGTRPLTVWTTELFSPTQSITSGQILAQEIAVFQAEHDGVGVDFVLKKPYGGGGLLDLVLKTAPVVPELLPDLIVIDVDELPTLAEAGLVQPLDGLLPADLVSDLYPFAREAASLDGRLYGVQFQADVDHIIYNPGKIALAPRSWAGVLSTARPYVFPAGGKNGLVNDAFLIQYLAVRTQTGTDGEGQPFLDAASITTVLQFYYDALSRGVLPPRVASLHSTDDSWNEYISGQADLAQVSAHRYLLNRGAVAGSAVAAIPSMHGPAAPIARGWALALVTTDPTRQAAAVDLIVHMMQPTINATWNEASASLPTRAAAMAAWPATDSYGRFIQEQLQEARPRPRLTTYTQVMAALQEAISAVMSGEATPEQAGSQALTPR